MMLDRAIRAGVEYTDLDWSVMQTWFQKFFFSGEDIPGTQAVAERLSPIAAAHRILTNAMSVLPVGLYRKENGARYPVRDDGLDWLLKVRANEAMSPPLMRKVLMSQAFWHGMGALWKYRGHDGGIAELIPLYTKDLSIRKDMETGALWYDCMVDGMLRSFAPSELVLVFFETYDGIHGRGVLDLAKESVSADAAAQRYARKFYTNGAKMSGIVEVNADLGAEGRQKIKNEFKKYAAGGDDAFRVAVLDRDMKYTPIGLNQAEAQFIESRSFSVAEASRFTGVPEFMLQSGKQSFESNQQQQLSFVTNTLMPHVVQWEGEFGYKLLDRARLLSGHYMKCNLAALLRGDDQSRAKFYQLMVYCGIYNLDECRAFEEMNPLPDGLGIQHFMTKNLDTLAHIVEGVKS